MKYGKLEDGKINYAPRNFITEDGQTILNFNSNEELMLEYGFKPIQEADKPYYPYSISYKETKLVIKEIIIPNILEYKNSRLEENKYLRDECLNAGVTYKGILFDSDTDQKINILGVISRMSDEDTTIWYGMNNDILECTKEDLFNIGILITKLNTYCWTKNTYIQQRINNANTVQEIEEVEIIYNFSEENLEELLMRE